MEVRGLTEWTQLSGVEHGVTSAQFSQFVERCVQLSGQLLR